MEGIIGFIVKHVYRCWQDKASRIVWMEHSPSVMTWLNVEDTSIISSQKDYESKAQGSSSSQLQRSGELADSKSGEMTSCPANAQAYISVSNPLSSDLGL